MRKLVTWLLPEWAQPGNPLLQYELSKSRGNGTRRGFALQLVALVLLLAAAAFIYASATEALGDSRNVSGLFWQSLYFPTLFLQLITLIVALSLGAASVDSERSRKTWDNLRVTEGGAGMALRARWIGILYRLRAPIAAILIVRLVFSLGTLIDLTAFGGLYAEMLSANATPPLADWRIGLLLIALTLTVNVLLPLLMIASSAALGILLSVAVKERIYGAVTQVLLAVLQVVFVIAAAAGISQILQDSLILSDHAQFLLVLTYCTYGDWGMLLAQLGSLGEIWQRIPSGTLISLGLPVVLLVQAFIADGMIALAERLSESRG